LIARAVVYRNASRMSHDGFHENLEAKRSFSAVVRMVGFGPRRSKMLYLSRGIDCLPLRRRTVLPCILSFRTDSTSNEWGRQSRPG
jgi:hypothetical protein